MGVILVDQASSALAQKRKVLLKGIFLDGNQGKNQLVDDQGEVVLLRLGREILRNAHGQQQRIIWRNNSKLVQLKVGMDFSVDFPLDRLRTHTIQGAQVDLIL